MEPGPYLVTSSCVALSRRSGMNPSRTEDAWTARRYGSRMPVSILAKMWSSSCFQCPSSKHFKFPKLRRGAWCLCLHLVPGTLDFNSACSGTCTDHCSITLVSIIRLWSLDDVVKSNDLPFDSPAFVTLSAVELNVAIICACLPAMRPLLALMLPKYFSAAAHYTNVPRMLDLDSPSMKHVYAPSTSTRSNTPRAYTPMNNPSRTGTPQAPRPTLSRNSSGHFIVHNPDPPTPPIQHTPTPGQMVQLHHSRSGSNISIDIAAAEARANKLRQEERPHPLRSSPVTASRPRRPPRSPTRLSLQSLGPGYFTIKPSESQERLRPKLERADTDKRLPSTPFPVGTAV